MWKRTILQMKNLARNQSETTETPEVKTEVDKKKVFLFLM